MNETSDRFESVVIDASVAIAFALEHEKHHGQAILLISNLVKNKTVLCSPSIFAYECDSVIRRHVHLGTLHPRKARHARDLIAALKVGVRFDPTICARAYEIAEQHDQPRVYDATYVAFAEARGLDLWTDDKRFYNSVSSTLPFVKFIGNLTLEKSIPAS